MSGKQNEKIDIIMEKLREANAEYNKQEAEEYAKVYLRLPQEELQQKSGQEIKRCIYQELEKRYNVRY